MSHLGVNLLAAMELLSLPMLGWLVVGVLPWLIHWFSRRTRQEIPWAAVEVLLAAVRKRARLVRFQQWLLLAVRTLILILVVVGVAQPVWHRQGTDISSHPATHHILIVDRSYSMTCNEPKSANTPASSRFAVAQATAREVIESSATGDVITVIGWDRRAEDVLGRVTFEPSQALAAVDQLATSQTKADLTAVLLTAEEAVARVASEQPGIRRHRTLIFSDLTRNTWQAATDTSSEEAKLCRRLAERGELAVVNVAEEAPPEGLANAAVADLVAEPPRANTGEPVSIAATLQTFGDRQWPAADLVLSVDGTVVERQEIELPEHSPRKVWFEHRFVDPGQHVVHVSLERDSEAVDCLALDNERWLVVETAEQLRIACIAGRPGAADDVVRALAPGNELAARDNLPSRQPIQVDRFPASRLPEVDLTRYDALVLCNVADWPQRQSERIVRFIQQGGGVIFFLGNRILAERYNEFFSTVLPIRIESIPTEGAFHFDPLGYRHPIIEAFRDEKGAGLLSVDVSKYFVMKLGTAVAAASGQPPVETALALETGDPAILIGNVGLGGLAVVALPGSLASRTATGTPWSSWAVNPSFLPVVRETLAYLVGGQREDHFNKLVGQPILYSPSAEVAGQPLVVQMPTGVLTKGQVADSSGGSNQLLIDTPTSGIYTLLPGGTSTTESTPEEPAAKIAINLDTRESDLAHIHPNDLPESITRQMSTSRSTGTMAGIPLQGSLFAAALVLLFAELLLAWWMGRGWG